VAEHNSRYDGTPYHRAAAASAAWDGPGVSEGMNLAVAGSGGTSGSSVGVISGDGVDDQPTSPPGSGGPAPMGAAASGSPGVVDGTAHEIAPPRPARSEPLALPAGAPDFDAARARIAEQGPVGPQQLASAIEQLDDGERAHVRDAAQSARALQQAAGGEEGDVYFRERIAAGIADGRTFGPASQEHAAVIGAGSHPAVIDALDSLADPKQRPAHEQSKYTERELRRDWTEPVQGDDDGARR
jgi:hypothetical protein